ncbi:MAG: SDR family oxidoreductase [Carboxylicivirga sp.]|jgi:NAD(P)-dependent dehydrogenase (short-subunit alcohol dehydrogenase family)|nr:SDR family oxidoreductase [Carboxylicivirga sp.]
MEQRIVLVTGSNRGIGLATVKELLIKGYKVILTARKAADGLRAQSKLQEFGDVYFHTLDVADPDSVEQIKAYVEKEFGRLDILINNAGINYDSWHTASNADLNEVEETFRTNLIGAWRMAQTFLPMMVKQKYGRIVNVSSGAGSFNEMGGGTPGYSISKASLNALTIKLAVDVKGKNILVNAVCPGWVRTDMGGLAAPRSPKKGAETIIWAAELPDKSFTGKFFRDMKEIHW